MEEAPIVEGKDIKTRFWQSVQERAMKLPWCNACGKSFFFPRPFCPACWSEDVDLRPVSGTGTVWAHTVVRMAHGPASPWHQRLPYVLALVELEEGLRIMANVIGCPVEQVHSGMPVRLTYANLDGRTLYAFEPAP